MAGGVLEGGEEEAVAKQARRLSQLEGCGLCFGGVLTRGPRADAKSRGTQTGSLGGGGLLQQYAVPGPSWLFRGPSRAHLCVPRVHLEAALQLLGPFDENGDEESS